MGEAWACQFEPYMKHLQHTYETSETLETCVCNMGEAGAGRFEPTRSESAVSGGARAPPARCAWEGATQPAEVGARDGRERGSSSERAVRGEAHSGRKQRGGLRRAASGWGGRP